MTLFNQTSSQIPAMAVQRPMPVTVFGVFNIVFGCYFLARLGQSWYKVMTVGLANTEAMNWTAAIPFFSFLTINTGLIIWLIVLGYGLLKMKKWARRGAVLYGWIQVALIAIVLLATLSSMITSGAQTYRISVGPVNIGNVLAVIRCIYIVLMLIFMQTAEVKKAFAAVEG